MILVKYFNYMTVLQIFSFNIKKYHNYVVLKITVLIF